MIASLKPPDFARPSTRCRRHDHAHDLPMGSGFCGASEACFSRALGVGGGKSALDSYPHLSAYIRRCEARPAFQRAMKAQMESFKNAA